jgi:hypothetical protein
MLEHATFLPRFLKAIAVSICLLHCLQVQAQTEQTAQEDLLEYFFLNNEQASESDGQIFLEQINYLRSQKLDLNTASFVEMTSSQLISPAMAQQLIAYRISLGKLISIHELQAVPGWSLDDIRRLEPFIEIGNLDTKLNQGKLWPTFLASKKDILLRYTPPPDNLPTETEGNGHGIALRLRAQSAGRLRFGLLMEKDPGEAFFAGSNKRGFDSYLAYLFIKNSPEKRIKVLALGNYQIRLGQGLIMYSGLAFGKSPMTTLVLRGADAIGPFTSFSEGLAMRGAASTIKLSKHLETTVFASYARRDANLSLAGDTLLGGTEEIFTALQSSGLHRTTSEIADEKIVTETAIGSSVRWANAQTEVSAQVVGFAFDKPWQPTQSPYRAFVFTGKSLLAGSLAYRTVYKNLIPFGETAVSQNGGLATTNGVILSPDRKASIALLHRYLARNYQNIYGNPFADGSSGNNESGIYMGLEVRPRRGWTFNAYADVWRNPWLRFNADLPAPGHDVLMRLTYVKKRSFTTYIQVQKKTRHQNTPSSVSEESGLIRAERIGLRLHLEQSINAQLVLRSRIEHSWFKYEGTEQTTGYLAYTEVIYKRNLDFPVSFSLRYALFDIPRFENSIYTYEQDVTSAFSVPPSNGQGSRAYLNVRWFLHRNWTLEGRIARTYLATTSSTSQNIGNSYFYRMQMKVDF